MEAPSTANVHCDRNTECFSMRTRAYLQMKCINMNADEFRQAMNAIKIQRWGKFFVRGLVKFVLAVAYHFCLSLPATFSQPRTNKFSHLCSGSNRGIPTFIFGTRELHVDCFLNLSGVRRTKWILLKARQGLSQDHSLSDNDISRWKSSLRGEVQP